MELVEVSGHTIDKSILSDGVIIDVGCRAFEFANYFEGKKVFCIDPDPKVFEDELASNPSFINLNLAISDSSGDSAYYENGEGTCLKEIDPDQGHPFQPCKTITMDDLYEITGTNVDVLKLDCEGAEYIILGEDFKPIPKQISVEFHYHCVPALHDSKIGGIIQRLLKNYDIHNFEWEERHGCGANLWDVLFIKKTNI